jgi:hypothetical protein
MAPRSVHRFVPFFASMFDHDPFDLDCDVYLIASCDTHDIASIVKSFSLDAHGVLDVSRFVCLSGAYDVSQDDSFSPSPTITKHDHP